MTLGSKWGQPIYCQSTWLPSIQCTSCRRAWLPTFNDCVVRYYPMHDLKASTVVKFVADRVPLEKQRNIARLSPH